MEGFDIFDILKEISSVNKDLGDTITESTKGAAAMGGSTAAGALTGALIGGPIGMFVGAAIGFAGGTGIAAATVKTFKPLHQVLGEMSEEEKSKLVEIAKKVIKEKGIDLAVIIAGKYGSETAKLLLTESYELFSGKKITE